MQHDWMLIYCFVVISVLITWIIFLQWEWIIRNWWPTKSKANFKLLVPELEYAIKVCSHMFKTGEPLAMKDIPRMGELISRLGRMELVPLPKKENSIKTPTEVSNFLLQRLSEMLEYARAGKYKEYVDFCKRTQD